MREKIGNTSEHIELIFNCKDGYRLHGHLWINHSSSQYGTVILNGATGVLARFYHGYARYLSTEGFNVITYDYRGIGASRPPYLPGSGLRWRDWGELDFDAVVSEARNRFPQGQLAVVGHSIGGFLPGFAEAATQVDRFLTIGAQYAYWMDYAPSSRVRLVLKWHIAMPLLTAAFGYFPGRRLGWLEDLPAGVANEWSFRRAKFENSYPCLERGQILDRFSTVKAPILAVGVSDDEYGTPRALCRALQYYAGSDRTLVLLGPEDLGFSEVGHFDLFRNRHRGGFWQASCAWLRDGVNPWPSASAPITYSS